MTLKFSYIYIILFCFWRVKKIRVNYGEKESGLWQDEKESGTTVISISIFFGSLNYFFSLSPKVLYIKRRTVAPCLAWTLALILTSCVYISPPFDISWSPTSTNKDLCVYIYMMNQKLAILIVISSSLICFLSFVYNITCIFFLSIYVCFLFTSSFPVWMIFFMFLFMFIVIKFVII